MQVTGAIYQEFFFKLCFLGNEHCMQWTFGIQFLKFT